MQPQPVISRSLVIVVSIVIIFFTAGTWLIDHFRTSVSVVFCDVGQGDAAYIRLRGGIDILIDAGPDHAVLSCLGKYMPFYDRTIELAILTHPDLDHYGGFLAVLDRYSVRTFALPPISKQSRSFSELISKLERREAKLFFPMAETEFHVGSAIFYLFWPTPSFLADSTHFDTSKILASSTRSANSFSLVFVLQIASEYLLFTGDLTPAELNTIQVPSRFRQVRILKVPHHGSKNGLTAQFLNQLQVTTAVISSGKKNTYGHPHKEVLEMLKTRRIKYVRTDTDGHIEIKISEQAE
jgi:competence protein ComEC